MLLLQNKLPYKSRLTDLHLTGLVHLEVLLLLLLGVFIGPTQHESWNATSCRLSSTAFYAYLQLPSMFGGLLRPQPEDSSCRDDKEST